MVICVRTSLIDQALRAFELPPRAGKEHKNPLEAWELTRRFGGFTAVHHISFFVEQLIDRLYRFPKPTIASVNGAAAAAGAAVTWSPTASSSDQEAAPTRS